MSLRHGLAYAWRSLARAPLFSASVILTLTIGIGSAAAIFAVVNAVLIRPLPYGHPDRLVGASFDMPALSLTHAQLTAGTYRTFKQFAHTIEGIAIYKDGSISVADPTRAGDSERLSVGFATANTYSLLEVRPLLGRTFSEAEDTPHGANVAMISEGLWRSRYGGDKGIVGKSLMVAGKSTQIIGVMSAQFRFPSADTKLWLPLQLDPNDPYPGGFNYDAVARLRARRDDRRGAAGVHERVAAGRRALPELGAGRPHANGADPGETGSAPHADARRRRGRDVAHAVDGCGHRAARAPRDLRQRREPAAGTRRRTTSRIVCSRCSWCRAPASARAFLYRVRIAGRGLRGTRPRRRGAGDSGTRRRRAVADSPIDGGASRRCCRRVYGDRRRPGGVCVQRNSGDSIHAQRSDLRLARRRTRRDDRRTPPAGAKCARGCADGIRARRAFGVGIVAAQLSTHARGATGVRRRGSGHALAVASVATLRERHERRAILFALGESRGATSRRNRGRTHVAPSARRQRHE